MRRAESLRKSVLSEHLIRKPAHMGQPVGWNGRVYGADEEIRGCEHATQTPLRGETGEKDYHEWHYAHLATEQGDLIVIGFFTKQIFLAALGPTPISPGILVDCVMHDGAEIDTLKYYKHYRASHENLDIEVGDSWLKAKDDRADQIHLHVMSVDFQLDVEMNRTAPAFRSKTGKTVFGDGTKWEAWDIIQPAATMHGHLTHKGKKRQIRGNAYVDHAYGNELFGVHHWYWTPVDIGPYKFVVAANYTADKHLLGKERDHLVTFMVARDGMVIGRDPEKAQFIPQAKEYLQEVRRHVAKQFGFRYTGENREFLLTLKQRHILRVKPLLAMMVKNKLIAEIARRFAIGGPYFRAIYDAWLDVRENGQLVEQYGPDDCNAKIIGEVFYPGNDDTDDYAQLSP